MNQQLEQALASNASKITLSFQCDGETITHEYDYPTLWRLSELGLVDVFLAYAIVAQKRIVLTPYLLSMTIEKLKTLPWVPR